MDDNNVLRQIKDFLKHYTGCSTYWYPLCALKKDIPVIVYNLDKIYKDNCIEQLEATLKSYGLSKVQSFQMQNENTKLRVKEIISLLYEKDEDGYNFPWCVETYYFDDSKEWMIYVSHEGTITFTGSQIVSTARENIQSKFLYM